MADTCLNKDPLDVRNANKIKDQAVEIMDLFQRNGELLDRLIRLENKFDEHVNSAIGDNYK